MFQEISQIVHLFHINVFDEYYVKTVPRRKVRSTRYEVRSGSMKLKTLLVLTSTSYLVLRTSYLDKSLLFGFHHRFTAGDNVELFVDLFDVGAYRFVGDKGLFGNR